MSSGIKSSRPVSLVFMALFIIMTICQAVMMIWKRTWFMFWLIVGGILEITAYATKNQGNGTQTVQAIIAPVFIAAYASQGLKAIYIIT